MTTAPDRHVVLVGLMGVGKTTIGRRVASRLGRPFIDADSELERESAMTIRDLFTAEGEEGFRTREAALLAKLLSSSEPAVIAAGGGVVVRPENREVLRSGACQVIYLHAEPAFLASRVSAKSHRPLLDEEEPAEVLARLAIEREGWYREVADDVIDAQAHYTRLGKPKAKDRIADEIASAVRARLRSEKHPSTVTVGVHLGTRSYDVLVGPGVRDQLRELVPETARRAAIVTQAGIGFEIDPGVEHAVFPIGHGEAAKNLATVEQLARDWTRWGLTRDDLVVAVGGGVVTDTAGFAAASYHRGVAVLHVPTTLLGMVDAAIGGKTGVNLPEGKNLVGAFWQPCGVLCDTDALATLPAPEKRSGWGEVAKYHFLTDEDLAAMDEVGRIAACVRIKARIVAEDETESGVRALLNYGHTLAHALETAGRYDMRHGEAVAVGLVYAARLAAALGRIDERRVAEHVAVVSGYDLPSRPPEGSDVAELVEIMRRDKKARDGLTFVLDGPRGVEVVPSVPEDVARATLDEMVG